jgi:hypothetical protein
MLNFKSIENVVPMKNSYPIGLFLSMVLMTGCATGIKTTEVVPHTTSVVPAAEFLAKGNMEVEVKYSASTRDEHLFLVTIHNKGEQSVVVNSDSAFITPYALSHSGRRLTPTAMRALDAEDYINQMERRYNADRTKAKVAAGVLIAGVAVGALVLTQNPGAATRGVEEWLVPGRFDLLHGAAVASAELGEMANAEAEIQSQRGSDAEIRAAEGLLFDHTVDPGEVLVGPMAFPRIKARWFVITLYLNGERFDFPFEER